MIKEICALTAAAAITITANAQTIKPLNSGANLNFVAQASLIVPNDMATLYFSATKESADLPTAQSELNKTMATAQAALKDFSSLIQIQNNGYSTYPVYNQPKKGEAPKIVAWRASQNIRVTTEDIVGVPALVQTAQTNNLALDNINYGLTPSTKEATQEKLIAGVVDSVNKKASNIAYAMKLPVEVFYLEKLEFNQGFQGVPRDFALKASMVREEGNFVQLPSFEPGNSTVDLSARAYLKIVPDQN